MAPVVPLNAIVKEAILMSQQPQRMFATDAIKLRALLDEIEIRLKQGTWEEISDETILATAGGTRKLMVFAYIKAIQPALDDPGT